MAPVCSYRPVTPEPWPRPSPGCCPTPFSPARSHARVACVPRLTSPSRRWWIGRPRTSKQPFESRPRSRVLRPAICLSVDVPEENPGPRTWDRGRTGTKEGLRALHRLEKRSSSRSEVLRAGYRPSRRPELQHRKGVVDGDVEVRLAGCGGVLEHVAVLEPAVRPCER